MRVLMLSEAPYPHHGGGAGKFAHLLATGLVRRGHNVHLLWYGGAGGPPHLVDGIDIHSVPILSRAGIGPQDMEPLVTKSLFEYLETHVPVNTIDVVHDACGFLSFFSPLAHQLGQIFSVPVVTHFEFLQYHNALGVFGRLHPYSRVSLALEETRYETPQCFAVRISDRIICPCRSEAALVQKLYCPPPASVTVIPNPVRLHNLSRESVAAVRNRLARPGERLILFGGRIGTHQKNSPAVLNAVRRLLAKRFQLRLILAAEDQEAVKRFRLVLGDAVTSVGWIRDAEEIARLLAAVDVVVMPSVYESFGQMAAEAMAVATPVIVSPVGAMPELIRDGENGFILDGDPRRWDLQLEQRLAVLLKNEVLRLAMGQRAKQTVEENISIERVTTQIEDLYRELQEIPRAARNSTPGMPILSPQDRNVYLNVLSKRGGEEALQAGTKVLAHWPVTVERRCMSCNHHRIAVDTQRLIRLVRARLFNWLPWMSPWPQTLDDIVASECPLALLQKEHLRSLRLPVPLKQIIKIAVTGRI